MQSQDAERYHATARRTSNAMLFLTLPAEIRNQIYEYVLEGWVIAMRMDPIRRESPKVDIWAATTSPYRIHKACQTQHQSDESSNVFSLLYTCRQIHAETRLLPYSLNALLCGENQLPRAWLETIYLAQTRRIVLCSWTPANIALPRFWLEMLSWFECLEQVDIWWPLFMPPWGLEEDHLSTTAIDKIDMTNEIRRVTFAACKVRFHPVIVPLD